MRRALRHGLSTHGSKQRPVWRVMALLALCLFQFQLIRVFLVVPVDWYECSSTEHHTHDEASRANHHREGVEVLVDNDTEGNSIQHCKDTIDGLGLIPVVTFASSSALSQTSPQVTWAVLHAKDPATLDGRLSEPFQPPRSLT